MTTTSGAGGKTLSVDGGVGCGGGRAPASLTVLCDYSNTLTSSTMACNILCVSVDECAVFAAVSVDVSAAAAVVHRMWARAHSSNASCGGRTDGRGWLCFLVRVRVRRSMAEWHMHCCVCACSAMLANAAAASADKSGRRTLGASGSLGATQVERYVSRPRVLLIFCSSGEYCGMCVRVHVACTVFSKLYIV